MHIITQLLTIVSTYGEAWSTKKQHIILCRMSSSFFNALSLLLVGNVVGALPIFFTVIRCIVCYSQDRFKSNLPIYLVCLGYVGIGIISVPLYSSVVDLFPLVMSLASAIVLWFCSPMGIKMGVGLGDSLWMIYNLINGLYFTAANIACQLVVTAISMVRIKKNKHIESNPSINL